MRHQLEEPLQDLAVSHVCQKHNKEEDTVLGSQGLQMKEQAHMESMLWSGDKERQKSWREANHHLRNPPHGASRGSHQKSKEMEELCQPRIPSSSSTASLLLRAPPPPPWLPGAPPGSAIRQLAVCGSDGVEGVG
ncbi:unnamed protein product [Arctogadus glacialis]